MAENRSLIRRFADSATGAVKGIGSAWTRQESTDYKVGQMVGWVATALDQYQTVDDLVEQKGLKVYDDMMTDGEVSGAINEKRFDVISADWAINPASEDERDVAIADFITWTLTDMRGSIPKLTWNILNAFVHGFSVGEIILKPITEGEYSGRWGIDRIKGVEPHYLKFVTDQAGQVVGLEQDQTSGPTKTLDLEKYIIYSYNSEYDRVWGQSDLRPVYKHYWSKSFLIKFWNVYLEAFGTGIRLGKYPANTTSEREKTALLNALRDTMNNTAITISKDFEIELLFPSSRSEFEAAVRYHDEQIRKRIVGQNLTSGQGRDVGSMALGNIHQETKEDYTTFVRKDLAETVFNEQIIKPLVRLNFPGVTWFPEFVWQPRKGKVQITQVADIKTLIESGLITVADANILRRRLDLPESAAFDNESTEVMKISGGGGLPFGGQGIIDVEAEEVPETKALPPGDKEPDEDDIDEAMKSTKFAAPVEPVTDWKPWRAFTAAESRLGASYFAEQSRQRATVEERVVGELKPVFKSMQKNLEKYLRTDAYVNGKWNVAALGDARLMKAIEPDYWKYADIVIAMIQGITEDQYIAGLKTSNADPAGIPEKESRFAVNTAMDQLAPAEVLAQIDAAVAAKNWKRAKTLRIKMLQGLVTTYTDQFWMTDVTNLDIVKEVKQVLRSATANGLGINESMKSVSQVFYKYGADNLTDPSRLRSIVRTNQTKAISDAHLNAYRDPEIMADFPMVQYSAILDDVTTDICRSLDGKVWRSDDPELTWISPPKHHNCRSDIIAVPFSDPIIKQGPSPYPNRENMPEGFGGLQSK